ncbi:MAG: BamA/TamA family outer membrane protein [Psychromonas sp.]
MQNRRSQFSFSFIVFCTGLVLTHCSYADIVAPLLETPDDLPPTIIDKALVSIGADAGFDRSKGLDVSYIPSVFYNPEMEFGGGFLAIGLYKIDSATEQEQPSSVVVNTYVSTNLSAGVTVDNITFFNQGKDRLPVYFEVHDEPKVYYGKGYESNDNDNNKIRYTETMLTLNPKWMREVHDNFFLGLGADFTFIKTRHEEVDQELELGNPSLINDLEANTTFGVSASALYDSRDYILNPTEGWLLQMDAGAYYNEIDNSTYGKYDIEILNFTSLNPVPGLLAFQVQANLSSGEVPWNMLSDLGGAYAMRGYILGRYRDNQMAMAQVEYRLPLYRRSGAVFWTGVGSIGDDVSDLSNDVLATYGVGYRFLLKGRINVRADLGFGKNETGFYFNVNEVF